MPDYCSLEEAFNIQPPSKKREGFRSLKPTTPPPSSDNFENASRKSYGAQATDYKYMCDTAGICIDEKFKNQAPNAQKCAPLAPQKYEYPMSEEDKTRFKQVIKIALEEMETSKAQSPPVVPEAPSAPSMNQIDGYIDSELESYMMVNDMKTEEVAIQKPPTATAAQSPKDMAGYVKQEARGGYHPFPFTKETETGIPVSKGGGGDQSASAPPPENFTKKYKILFDLLLFSITGILIILIIEQLFKLALLQGMNKTVTALETIIKERATYQPSV